MMAYLGLILIALLIISAFVLSHYAEYSSNSFLDIFSFIWSIICVCLVAYEVGVPLMNMVNNDIYLKDKYEATTYMINVYDEENTPYDAELINKVMEWNAEYDKYVKHMNGPFGILYPDKLIEGTERITLLDE